MNLSDLNWNRRVPQMKTEGKLISIWNGAECGAPIYSPPPQSLHSPTFPFHPTTGSVHISALSSFNTASVITRKKKQNTDAGENHQHQISIWYKSTHQTHINTCLLRGQKINTECDITSTTSALPAASSYHTRLPLSPFPHFVLVVVHRCVLQHVLVELHDWM